MRILARFAVLSVSLTRKVLPFQLSGNWLSGSNAGMGGGDYWKGVRAKRAALFSAFSKV